MNEPEDCWDENPQVEYERYVKNQLEETWTIDDLKLECADCSVESEDVSSRFFQPERDADYNLLKGEERVNLCEKCYEKRTSESDDVMYKGSTIAGIIGDLTFLVIFSRIMLIIAILVFRRSL